MGDKPLRNLFRLLDFRRLLEDLSKLATTTFAGPFIRLKAYAIVYVYPSGR